MVVTGRGSGFNLKWVGVWEGCKVNYLEYVQILLVCYHAVENILKRINL